MFAYIIKKNTLFFIPLYGQKHKNLDHLELILKKYNLILIPLGAIQFCSYILGELITSIGKILNAF